MHTSYLNDTMAPVKSSQFQTFPPEIRAMILKELGESSWAATQAGSNDRLGPYGTVCKEWQAVLEPYIYRRIKLSPLRLPMLNQLVRKPCRKFVKHVWLDLDVEVFFLSSSVGLAVKLGTQETLSGAVKDLFLALATWKGAELTSGLTLEITTRSVVDRSYQPALGGQRLEDDRQLIRLTRSLPRVDVVKKFLFRNQYYSSLDFHTFYYILHAMPMVDRMHLESRLNLIESGTVAYGKMYITPNLRNLSWYKGVSPFCTYTPRRPSRYLALKLCHATKLECLVVSFAIDARHFLRPFYEDKNPELKDLPQYRDLELVILTSSDLGENKRWDTSNELLRAAGLAAIRMPKLQKLVIWNATVRDAAVFSYCRGPPGKEATITCSTTWSMPVLPRAEEAWVGAILSHGCSHLVTREKTLPRSPFKLRDQCLKHLGLESGVICPTSLHRLQEATQRESDV